MSRKCGGACPLAGASLSLAIRLLFHFRGRSRWWWSLHPRIDRDHDAEAQTCGHDHETDLLLPRQIFPFSCVHHGVRLLLVHRENSSCGKAKCRPPSSSHTEQPRRKPGLSHRVDTGRVIVLSSCRRSCSHEHSRRRRHSRLRQVRQP